MASRAKKRQREQYCQYCGKDIPGGNRARHYKARHAGEVLADEDKEEHNNKVREPNSVSEWLGYCAVDLSVFEVPWPLEKLDQLQNLRTQSREYHDQCIAWHVFKDERTAWLPSLERVLVNLDAA
jgi:hypothetical protein